MVGSAFADDIPADEKFRVETLSEGLVDAMEITVLPNGEVLIVERTGALKRFSPVTGETKLVHTFEVSIRRDEGFASETGLLGIAAHPEFDQNGWIFCYYSAKTPDEHRLSRFTLKEGTLGEEKILLHIPQSRKYGVCHEGGSLAFDASGNLFLSTGDNANPFAAGGYPPLDEREGREWVNSQRSASNTNDLRGKIIRIRPTDDGGYEIPEGNLFPPGTDKTRPEIYAMGCRNPWRIGVNQKTGTVYWGDVGPDARNNTDRGPQGYCEINQAKQAGNHGWPQFIANNEAYARYDFGAKKAGKKFNPEKPLNESRYNTGLKQLPPAVGPLWYQRRSCFCAGPVYHFQDSFPAGAMPAAMDNCLITYDWNNGRMQLTLLDDEENMVWKKNWLGSKKFIHPSDIELGPDGAVYVLEYGSKWYDGTDGKLKRITYSESHQEVADADILDPRLEGLKMDHPGTKLLSAAICLSCHQTQEKSVGPRYLDVAERYRDKEDAVAYLVEKILKGGVGAWGEVPMPPNPQFNEEQASQMVDAILSLEPGGHKQ